MATVTQTINTVPTLPTPPDPNDPVNFDALAFPYITAQNAFAVSMVEKVNQLNTFASQVNTLETNVNAKEASAISQVDLATAQAQIAVASANYKGDWVSGYATTGYSLGMSVSFTDGINYVSKINNNLTSPVTGTNTTQWRFIEAINYSQSTIASSATTSNIWGLATQINWTGIAITTGFPPASQAGLVRTLICAGACSFTAGTNMLIDGVASGSTVVCAINDTVTVRAISTSIFKITIQRADGTSINSLLPMNVLAPNNTIPVAGYIATNNSHANIDVAFAPKGLGSFALAIADGTAVGGNKRGANAIDLQTVRNLASDIASGAYSIAIGIRNTASGAYASSIGSSNIVDAIYSSAIGVGNLVQNNNSFALGNNHNITSGYAGSTAINSFASNRGMGNYFIMGNSYGAGTNAYMQTGELLLSATTTAASAVRATVNGSGVAAQGNQLYCPLNSAIAFNAFILAKNTGVATIGSIKGYQINGIIACGATIASTIVTLSTATTIGAGTFAGTVALAADTTYGCLAINCTGVASTTTNWNITIFTFELINT